MNSENNLKSRLEDELLLCCARTSIDSEIKNKILFLIQKNLDWQHLLAMASKHKLKPLLFHNLNAICPNKVPEDILANLRDEFNDNMRKNLLFLGILLKLLNLFESRNIKVIPFKGPILAILIYKNIALREFNDLDIFIHEKDFFFVKKILISQGYMPKLNLNHSKEIKYIKYQRELAFLNKETKINIDIHWKLSTLFFSLPKGSIGLFEQKNLRIIEINNTNILSLSNEDLFLVLCLHNASHRWIKLSLICDVGEFINYQDLNWIEIMKKATSLHIKRILFINLFLVNNCLGIKIPEVISQELNSDKFVKSISLQIIKNLFSTDYTRLSEEILMSFQIRENRIYGIKDIINGVLIPHANEWELNFPVFLFPLLYLLRPFLLLKRYKF